MKLKWSIGCWEILGDIVVVVVTIIIIIIIIPGLSVLSFEKKAFEYGAQGVRRGIELGPLKMRVGGVLQCLGKQK